MTLLSDFGTADGFVGAMKGVILSRASDAQIVDLTHDIPPQDVWAGAWALREAAGVFPKGAIHLAVVDPGVGTKRRALLLYGNDQFFVGPDNGLLSLAVGPDAKGWLLEKREFFGREVSSTFHGRDIFASVAGHLAAGVKAQDFGSMVQDWVKLIEDPVVCKGNEIEGRVVHVDRFGNLITNVDKKDAKKETQWSVQIGDYICGPIRSTYGDVEEGEWVAYVGSSGKIEIAIRNGDAAKALVLNTHAGKKAVWKYKVKLCSSGS
ncbi:MAG: SAM-dependent chlorinase/fluorinase [Pseudomonadota bacterium]